MESVDSFIAPCWYLSVTRFTTSAFMRAKLGSALSRRKLSPHIFETEAEALAHVGATGVLPAGTPAEP